MVDDDGDRPQIPPRPDGRLHPPSLGVAVSSTLYDPPAALGGVLLVAAGFPVYWIWKRATVRLS